jgi:hypothetical protein
MFEENSNFISQSIFITVLVYAFLKTLQEIEHNFNSGGILL